MSYVLEDRAFSPEWWMVRLVPAARTFVCAITEDFCMKVCANEVISY
jgi:hypothetical protein